MDSISTVNRFRPRWQLPAYLVALWLTLGLLGHWALGSAWRNAQLDEFHRSMSSVAELAVYRPWSEPWESDIAWSQLEERLAIDLVPLVGSVAESEAVSERQVTWVLSPTGDWRATVTVPITERSTSSDVRAIRGTRVFSDHRINAVWWSSWTVLNLLILSAMAIARRWRTSTAIDSKLQPWLQLVRPTSQGFRNQLPILPPSADGTVDELNRLAQQVNARLSDLERARQRLELVLGNLSEGVLAVDGAARVLFANPVLREQLMLRTEDVAQRPLVEAVRLPRVVELLEYVLKTKQRSEQTIEIGTHGRYLRLLVTPLPLGEEQIGVLLTATDVSSTQRSELARREFITGASHELKTPLAAIRAYTETLQSISQSDPDTAQRFMHNILGQADRMDRLVTGMLQLARAESGALKLKIERIDAVAAIRPCLEAAVGMAQAKEIDVRVSMPAEQVMVMADRDAFQTIASNLLSNAVRYTPNGGRIDVQLQELTSTEDPVLSESLAREIVLRVSDTGIGIADADQERIFERFYRVQKDRALDSGGTGLGLAIVKQLTQVLEGSVHVTSRKGVGTSFEIRLPGVVFTKSSS